MNCRRCWLSTASPRPPKDYNKAGESPGRNAPATPDREPARARRRQAGEPQGRPTVWNCANLRSIAAASSSTAERQSPQRAERAPGHRRRRAERRQSRRARRSVGERCRYCSESRADRVPNSRLRVFLLCPLRARSGQPERNSCRYPCGRPAVALTPSWPRQRGGRPGRDRDRESTPAIREQR
jgi:hypothetical protein